MCGRFAITLPKEAMADLFDLAPDALGEAQDTFAPRYNASPGQAIAVVALGADGARKRVMMRWGLHPAWLKEPPGAKSMINARSETASQKPFFRDAFKKRRCLIAMDGFYEWKRDGAVKQPHFICRKDASPMVAAGLWERWKGEDGADVLTAAMLTTGPNAVMQPIHDRMPVLLERDAFALWLDPKAPKEALEWMMRPAADSVLQAWPVSTRVNRPSEDDAELIRSITSA
jgi:putative SOS response-associated peptidase YedK